MITARKNGMEASIGKNFEPFWNGIVRMLKLE